MKRDLPLDALIRLYFANNWSSAEKPIDLRDGLPNSHTLIKAWDGDPWIGLGNAISDSHLVVFYPNFLVDPDYHEEEIGSELMNRNKHRRQVRSERSGMMETKRSLTDPVVARS